MIKCFRKGVREEETILDYDSEAPKSTLSIEIVLLKEGQRINSLKFG